MLNMDLYPPKNGPSLQSLSALSSPVSFRRGLYRPVTSQLPEIIEGDENKVYVAVGRPVEKALSLLDWTFRHFKGEEVCILHVYQPSPFIPTLLGKLPASKANPEMVSAYREEEMDQTMKLLDKYLSICYGAKVKASPIMIETDKVHEGIVDLVNAHSIKKLVMGALPENCIKLKRSSTKAHYTAKNAPLFCEIWFINKGKHVWTREASECRSSIPSCGQSHIGTAKIFSSNSFGCDESKSVHLDSFRSVSARRAECVGVYNSVLSETVDAVFPSSPTLSCSTDICFQRNLRCSFNPTSASSSGSNSAKTRVSPDSDLKVEEQSLYVQLTDAKIEAEVLRKETFLQVLKRRKLESEALEAIYKMKAFESAHLHEFILRKVAEDELRTILEEQEKLLQERGNTVKELQRTLRSVALLDSRGHEANRRHDEAVGELKVIQSSIATLRQEKQQIQRQKMEALHWLNRWRNCRVAGATKCNDLIGFVEELPELAEFSLSDLQTATCDFSESFKIGQGGYGCIYKGEMLGRTVAIRKLHPHNVQGQSEFQQEVKVLGKLQHPHLVNLLGVCPEAWSLVYEYLSNGSLQDHLFRKTNIEPFVWKARVRIIAEIASALCFLHSSKPEKIVHGHLKPQNIILDSEVSCKICDFGICRLINEDDLPCPGFQRRTEPKSVFPYTDPEYQRTGVLTPKSDVYSLGLIILQLLTRRPPVGLASEVRRAVTCGTLLSLLDTSAGEWPISVARRLADLGLQCCELNGRKRPNISPSLVRELEQLHVPEERVVPPLFICPILKEIMHDPLVAADGYTYEGEAMREWLEGGKEISPMTNLKLSHLHLTPNHSLRLAIQNWLCKL